MEVFNIKDKPEYMEELSILELKEWGNKNLSKDEFNLRIKNKIKRIKNNLDNVYYCRLILLDGNNLIGFISIFPSDGSERTDLSPWYATMYVKKEYRGKGYSKTLNNAVLEEAKKRGFDKIYLKTDLVNYYEKFGAEYIEELENGEKLYCIDLR